MAWVEADLDVVDAPVSQGIMFLLLFLCNNLGNDTKTLIETDPPGNNIELLPTGRATQPKISASIYTRRISSCLHGHMVGAIISLSVNCIRCVKLKLSDCGPSYLPRKDMFGSFDLPHLPYPIRRHKIRVS